MVLGGVRSGGELVIDSFRVFRRYPKLVVPLLFVWQVLTVLIVWNRFFMPPLGGLTTTLVAGLGFAFVYTFLVAVSCSVLLEMVEHVERGATPSIKSAVRETVGQNLVRMLPLILVWSVVWFVLTVIQALFESDEERGEQSYSAEAAARTLAGGEGSLLGLSVDALKKGVRMIVFLILPAIAWEDRGFVGASKQGYGVFRDTISAFATGFSLTYIITALIFLPVGVVLELSDIGVIQLSSVQWYLVIGYIGVGWSLTVYLEQMFTADLFLWYKEWEQAVEAAEHGDADRLSMRDVPRPTLLDDVASLEERKRPGGESAPLEGPD